MDLRERFTVSGATWRTGLKNCTTGMQIGRTSCSSFWANTFRVVLTAAAYLLMQEMRLHLAPTRYARAQVSTLRERPMKLGAQVVISVRRIVLHLPHSFPDFDSFQCLACYLGARTGLLHRRAAPGNFYSSLLYSKYLISCRDLASDLRTELRTSFYSMISLHRLHSAHDHNKPIVT